MNYANETCGIGPLDLVLVAEYSISGDPYECDELQAMAMIAEAARGAVSV